MGKLEGKIALITGGTSGIGLAVAEQFVNEGAFVFIIGRRELELVRDREILHDGGAYMNYQELLTLVHKRPGIFVN